MGFCSSVTSLGSPPGLLVIQITALSLTLLLHATTVTIIMSIWLVVGVPEMGNNFIAACWALVTWTDVKPVKQVLPANLSLLLFLNSAPH